MKKLCYLCGLGGKSKIDGEELIWETAVDCCFERRYYHWKCYEGNDYLLYNQWLEGYKKRDYRCTICGKTRFMRRLKTAQPFLLAGVALTGVGYKLAEESEMWRMKILYALAFTFGIGALFASLFALYLYIQCRGSDIERPRDDDD